MLGKLLLVAIVVASANFNNSSCSIGSNFKANSFRIDSFPPGQGSDYMLPQVSGYFKEPTAVSSFKMNLYDQANNFMSWEFQAQGFYQPGQLSNFGDWVQMENKFPQSYRGQIILLNNGNEVACYSFSFGLFKIIN